MKVKDTDLHTLASLQSTRSTLMWFMGTGRGHAFQIYDADAEGHGSHAHIPASISMEVIGAALGIVTGRLSALGVHIPELHDRECYECAGKGTVDRDD